MATTKRTYGDGGITERDGKHQAQYRSADGRRVSKTFDTKRAASAWLREQAVNGDKGIMPANQRMTLGDHLERWHASHSTAVRAQTAIKYRDLLDRHIIPHLGRAKLAQLQPGDLASYYADRAAAGLGTATIGMCHTVLRRALQQATEWGVVPRNVAALVRPPRHAPQRMTPLSADQARALLVDVQGDQWEPLYHFCLMAGLRLGEALAVRWQDIDWRKGEVSISRQLVYLPKRGITFGETKTASGRRTVPLPAPTLAAVRAHRDRHAFQRAQAGDAWQDNDLVICTALGRGICPCNARREWIARRKRLGVGETRIHDLRHTYATMLLTAGVHPRVVQERLGHASVGETLNTYSHVIPAMHADATGRLTDLVYGENWQQIGSGGDDVTDNGAKIAR